MKLKNSIPLFLVVVALVVVLDQLTKMLAANYLMFPVGVIGGHLKLGYVTNSGIIFGVLQGFVWLPLFVSLIIIVLIVYNYKKLPATWAGQVLWALITGGAIGNLIGRIINGFVVDFIQIGFWPAFNVADSAITVGVIGLVIYLWREK